MHIWVEGKVGEDHMPAWEMVHHTPVREMEMVRHIPVREKELVDHIPVPVPKVHRNIHNHHKKDREKLPEAEE